MSKPAFEIKGGWLRVDVHRIRMSTIRAYFLSDQGVCHIAITRVGLAQRFTHAGLAEALDAWFEGEGEVKRMIGSGVRIDNDGNEREFVVDDKGNGYYYNATSKGLAT